MIADNHEFLNHSCDVGRSPSTLQMEFPNLYFGCLDETWWHQGLVSKNGMPVEPKEIFKQSIRSFGLEIIKMSEINLVIIGHGDVCRELAGFSMANCKVREDEFGG